MKKYGALIFGFIMAVASVSYAETYNICYEDLQIGCCEAVVGDEVLLPVRYFSELLGYYVEWNDLTREIVIGNSDYTAKIQIDNSKSVKNGVEMYINSAPVIINDSTYISADSLAMILDCEVNVSTENKSVELNCIDGFVTIENLVPNDYLPDLFAQDYLENNATPLENEWYSGNDIPQNVSVCFEKEVGYEAKMSTMTDDDGVKGEVFDLSYGAYVREFELKENRNMCFFADKELRSPTNKIAVMIESEQITSEKLWIDLDLFEIQDSETNGTQAFFVKAWHKPFDNKAIVVFNGIDANKTHNIWVRSVNDEPCSGKITIVSAE